MTETSFNRQTRASDFIAQVIAGKKGNARGFAGLVHVNGELKFLFVSTQIIVVHGYLELFLGVCIVCHQKDGACVESFEMPPGFLQRGGHVGKFATGQRSSGVPNDRYGGCGPVLFKGGRRLSQDLKQGLACGLRCSDRCGMRQRNAPREQDGFQSEAD